MLDLPQINDPYPKIQTSVWPINWVPHNLSRGASSSFWDQRKSSDRKNWIGVLRAIICHLFEDCDICIKLERSPEG